MNDRRLSFAVFSLLVSVLIFSVWSSIEVYAQQSSSNSSAPLASPQQHVSKIKITSPTKGQQVSVGKDLPIYGTSIGSNGTSNNDCKVSVIVNNVKPYQQANPGGTTTGNYSKWNFVLTSKYTIIKPGQNKVTAKYECANNPASKSFSSVNVTGVQDASVAATSATTTGAASVAASPKIQQVAITDTTTTTTHNPISDSTGHITWATIASLSKPDNTSSLLSSLPPSTPTTIAPQVRAISQQQQQQQQKQQPLIIGINMTGVNSTSAQNYTLAAIPLVPASGKLMYLGYHGDMGGDSSSSRGHTTSDSSSSNHKSGSSSDSSSSSDSKSSSNTIRISDSASTEKKKSSDSGNSKSIRADFTTADNTDSSSNTKSSSPANHNSGSSSDLATAIKNKVDSIIKNRIRGISDNTPFVLPFH